MAIDPDYLLNREWPKITQTYTEKDCMLYALGVGMGMDPFNEDELQFVFEENLKVLPSQAVMMAHPGFWAIEEDIDLDWVKILHLGQEIILHRPLPAAGTVEATTRFTEIVDKGDRGGALIVTDRVVSNTETGEELATLITTILARGDGGFSKERRPTRKLMQCRAASRMRSVICRPCRNRHYCIVYPATSIPCMLLQQSLAMWATRHPYSMACAPWEC